MCTLINGETLHTSCRLVTVLLSHPVDQRRSFWQQHSGKSTGCSTKNCDMRKSEVYFWGDKELWVCVVLFDMVGSCSVCLAAFLFSFLLLDPFIDFLKGLQQPFLLPCWPSEVIYHASWGTHKTGFKVGECWFVLWNRAWVLHLEWFISTIGWFLGIME